MADITTNYATTMRKHQGITPYGNESAVRCTLETNAAGGLVDSNQLTALQIADVVRLGPVLPAGMELHDIIGVISNVFQASTTCSIGFEHVDSDLVALDDVDYFHAAGLALDSASIFRKTTTTAPYILTGDAYVTVTWAGAANDEVGVLDLTVLGTMKGVE